MTDGGSGSDLGMGYGYGSASDMGYGYGSGSGGYGSGVYGNGMGDGMGGGYGYNMDRCCKKKYVEGASNPNMNGYYVLAERAEWWKVPSYCSSPCVYVKWSDMSMNVSDMTLQKYCFQPSQETQAMCAADEGI